MESEERIRRMRADGILTATQAEMLLASVESLGGKPALAAAASRRLVPQWAMAGGGAALVLALVAFAGVLGGDQGSIQDVTKTLNEPGGYGEMNRSLSVVLGFSVLLIPRATFSAAPISSRRSSTRSCAISSTSRRRSRT